MNLNTLQRLATVLLAVGFASAGTHASAEYVNISQVGATNTWNIDFSPITFTANDDGGTMDWLVFEDFYSAGSNADGDHVAGHLSISVNGGTAVNYAINDSTGTLDSSIGGIDPNDLFVNIAMGSTLSVNEDDTLLVTGSGIQFSSTDVPAPVTGTVQVAFWENLSASDRDVQTNFVSLTVGVPEPSTLVLGVFALLMLAGGVCLRRR